METKTVASTIGLDYEVNFIKLMSHLLQQTAHFLLLSVIEVLKKLKMRARRGAREKSDDRTVKKEHGKSAVPIGIFKNIKFYRIALSNDVRNPSVQYPWDFSFSHSKVFILGQKRI